MLKPKKRDWRMACAPIFLSRQESDGLFAGGLPKHRLVGRAHKTSSITASPRTKGPVLVVEDDTDTRLEIRQVLETAGYQVSEAENGRRALEILVSEDNAPCLILLDLAMPIMSGAELALILNRYYRLARIPVVIVAGAAPTENQLLEGIKYAAYLKKPFTPATLVDVVNRYALPDDPGTDEA